MTPERSRRNLETSRADLHKNRFVRACVGVLMTLAMMAAGCSEKTFPKAPAEGSVMSRGVVDPYLKIQLALASDSTEGVKANAGEIATAASALGAPAAKIDMAAIQLASAGELDDARAKFGVLSEAIDTYMTGLHLTPPEGVKIAFCPMARKPWMQQAESIANPYYGTQMLTCGSFR